MDKNKSAVEMDVAQKNIQFLEHDKSELLQAMEIIQNPKSLETNTILTDNMQVNALALMNWAGQVFDIEFFKQYVALYPRYKISGDNGIGRQQLIQIASAMQQAREIERKDLLDLLSRK